MAGDASALDEAVESEGGGLVAADTIDVVFFRYLAFQTGGPVAGIDDQAAEVFILKVPGVSHCAGEDAAFACR